MGSVLVLRWLWERVNLWSEAAAIGASLIAAPLLLAFVSEEWLRLALMSGASTLSVLLVTWLTPETEHSILDAFYRRVRPPGLWRRTAKRCGEDPERPGIALRRGSILVVSTALTIYLLLVGVIKLLLPAPGDGPWMGLVCLLVGLASIGLWRWRLHVSD
jgi:hypothetical protein